MFRALILPLLSDACRKSYFNLESFEIYAMNWFLFSVAHFRAEFCLSVNKLPCSTSAPKVNKKKVMNDKNNKMKMISFQLLLLLLFSSSMPLIITIIIIIIITIIIISSSSSSSSITCIIIITVAVAVTLTTILFWLSIVRD